MSKQKLEIKVDVPNGWRAIAFRVPRADDSFLDAYGRVYTIHTAGWIADARVIVEREWTPPAWMKSGSWLVWSPAGEWILLDVEPQISAGGRGWCYAGYCIHLNSRVIDWTPPPCDDWRESKRQILHEEVERA